VGTKYQNQAVTIMDEQIARLRVVLSEAQTRLGPATADLRQMARTIDELQVRSNRSDNNAIIARQLKQLKDRQHTLENEVNELQKAARSIEQLIRQTEMSSAALKNDGTQLIRGIWRSKPKLSRVVKTSGHALRAKSTMDRLR
jgi:chromosome segregation ATPase